MQVDWLNISSMTGGTGQTDVYAYVTENEKVGSVRNATVRFTNEEGLTADLSISQSSDTTDMRFVLSTDYLYVQGGGGTFYVNVLSNTYWKVTDYNTGLTITTDNQEGYGDGVLEIRFPINPNTDNTYHYDHYGRPFYGRDGYITVQSLMGTKRIYWEQAAYGAITVTPNQLVFPSTQQTLSVTVSSSTDWEITSYDSANTSFSALSGHSGETTIYVTKSALTVTEQDYYVTHPSIAVFSDGINTAVLNIDSEPRENYYIDDDYITVTYNVPEANTQVVLYAYDVELAITPTVQFLDNNHTEIGRSSFRSIDNVIYGQYYTTFTTAGEHIVKYKFNKDGCIMPKWAFPPAGITGVVGRNCYEKMVIGNRCQGSIFACAANGSGFKEIILGKGNITNIGEFAFRGCGSYDTDFVFEDNVQDYMLQPFHQFKARKFVYNRPELGGGDGSSTGVTDVSGSARKYTISGVTYSWTSGVKVTAVTAPYCSWEYPGDISCVQLVIGQAVQNLRQGAVYPYAAVSNRVSGDAYQVSYVYAGGSYGTNYPINGWSFQSIACVNHTPPHRDSGEITPVKQKFDAAEGVVIYGNFANFYKGPQRTIPLHYPIGADYSDWSAAWSNMVEDLNL